MTARTDVLDDLAKAGVRVDKANTSGNYADGLVLTAGQSYEREFQVHQLDIVACVAPGLDVDAFSTRVWQALSDSALAVPVSMETEFGSAPVPGRELPDADFATIRCVLTVPFGS